MVGNRKETVLLTIRILLGLLFIASGIGKLIESGDARYLVELMATEFYWLIEYTGPIVTATSILELVLGGWLLWGRQLSLVFTGSFLLVFFFTGVLGYFWLQGMSVESCGCFGALGFGGGIAFTLVRNLVLLTMIVTGYLLQPKPEIEEVQGVT